MAVPSLDTRDDRLIHLVQQCSQIVELEDKMKDILSKGYFGMTLARNSGHNISIQNCRADIDTSVEIDVSPEGNFELYESKPEINPLLVVCGLPPPALKKSQTHFKEALKLAIDVANIVNSILGNKSEFVKSISKVSRVCIDDAVSQDSEDLMSKSQQEQGTIIVTPSNNSKNASIDNFTTDAADSKEES